MSILNEVRERQKQCPAPTSGLNVAIDTLRLDGSLFSLFLSQNWRSIHSSCRLRDTSFRCSSVKWEIDLCAFDRKQPSHDDTKRAQLPHGELAADWRDSRFCTLSNPRQPVLPGREYSGESIARVIDASADVAFIRCVGNPVLERSDTLHGRVISFFFRFRLNSSNFVRLWDVTYVCWWNYV